MSNTIKVDWHTETPPEEGEYIVTVLEPLMYGSGGGSSYAYTLEVSYYSPDHGWDRHVVAWTDTRIEVYYDKGETNEN